MRRAAHLVARSLKPISLSLSKGCPLLRALRNRLKKKQPFDKLRVVGLGIQVIHISCGLI
jgi:hypothetical protein